jgi:exopolysaccharide biosynthesis polyprenyl glycosylphosphotransferase
MTTVSVSETLLADLGEEVWVAPIAVRRLGWRRVYFAALVAADLAAGLAAAGVVEILAPSRTLVERAVLTAGLAVLWLTACHVGRTHALGSMPALIDDLRAVMRVTVVLTALASFIVLAAQLSGLRSAAIVGLPAAGLLSASARVAGQRMLRVARNRGRCLNRVVVVGGEEEVLDLVGRMRRDPRMGLEPVGACLPGGGNRLSLVRHQVPVLGDVWDAALTAQRQRAAAVVVGAGPGIDATVVRRLGWQLEGGTADLVVAPPVTEVSKFRLTTRMLGSAPLMHVAGRERSPIQFVCKELIERFVAAFAVLVLAPVMFALAVVVRLTSDGPALFRQTRVGRDGREFTLLKFRTMVTNADALREELRHLNICEAGPLFKIVRDPRVTRIGSWLRRTSLDELPQLLNVVRGQMALVGPRPPLPSEVARYTEDVRRRLLVKPGLTGLWQVSGRSDLSWEESVRLDLRYVENWSLALDASILARTWSAVVKGRGAY